MDWNNPPVWLMIAVTWAIPLLIIGGLALGVFVTGRPSFTARGMKVYVDRALRGQVDPQRLEQLLDLFEDGLCPDPFERKAYREHLATVRCYLRDHKLKSGLTVGSQRAAEEGRPAPLYNGLTHSPTKIEVACDREFRSPEGKVLLSKTAMLYELLNATIWALDEQGVYVAYAESFIPAEDEQHWRWLVDADGDKDVDAEDVFAWKARRAQYDKAFKTRVQKYARG